MSTNTLNDVKKFLDEEGVLDSTLKSNTPFNIEDLTVVLYGIHCSLWGYRYEVCGSIRREKEAIRDIDLVISLRSGSTKALDMKDVFDKFAAIGIEVVTANHSGACLLADLGDGKFIRVDVLFCEPYNWGVATLFMTGSKDFNDLIRLHCSRQGNQFKPTGILTRNGVSCFTTEKEALEFMGIQYIEPKSRTSGVQMLDLSGKLIGVIF